MGDGDVGGACGEQFGVLYAEKLGPESQLQPLNVHLKTTVGVNRLPWPQYHAKPRIFVPDAWVALHTVFP